MTDKNLPPAGADARDARPDDWHPIEHAPKDGTQVELYRASTPQTVGEIFAIARWAGGDIWEPHWRGWPNDSFPATHFRRLVGPAAAGAAARPEEKVDDAPPTDIERWRTLYLALAWMVNDYIGVCGISADFTQKDARLGYAHEGYHNARIVLRDKPPVPWDGQRHHCVCNKKDHVLHTHYDEPPYNCARCKCPAYEPAFPAAAAAAGAAARPEEK